MYSCIKNGEKAKSKGVMGKPKGTLESETRSATLLLGQRPVTSSALYTCVGRLCSIVYSVKQIAVG